MTKTPKQLEVEPPRFEEEWLFPNANVTAAGVAHGGRTEVVEPMQEPALLSSSAGAVPATLNKCRLLSGLRHTSQCFPQTFLHEESGLLGKHLGLPYFLWPIPLSFFSEEQLTSPRLPSGWPGPCPWLWLCVLGVSSLHVVSSWPRCEWTRTTSDLALFPTQLLRSKL